MRSRAPTTRGQSEILGFVLVFAVVISAIVLLAVTGFAGLTDAKQTEHANNGVRAFDIFAENVDDLVRGRATHRSTELRLSGSQLTLGDPATVVVSGVHTSDPTRNFSYTVDVRPVEYAIGDDTTLSYDNGAVVRQDTHGGAVMLHDPSLVFTSDEVVLPIVQTRSLDGTAVGGEQRVNVRTSLAETVLLVAETDEYTVTYSVSSDQPDAWEAYFEANTAGTVTRSGNTVNATITTDRVYVTVARIDVSFE